MKQYIDKAAIVAEFNRLIAELIEEGEGTMFEQGRMSAFEDAKLFLDTLEVKEIKTSVIPKHSYFEHIYHCGSEPMWKIGDVLAVYEFYSDHEGEHVYGKITDVKMSEDEDWLYTFENGEVLYENMLISEEAYKKN